MPEDQENPQTVQPLTPTYWIRLTLTYLVIPALLFACAGDFAWPQAERGHSVCDSGPYRIVRHPGYAGNILPLVGYVLALSSLWTILPAAFALVIIIVRTALEDRTLMEELPGYADYAQKVRYRLFPGIY